MTEECEKFHALDNQGQIDSLIQFLFKCSNNVGDASEPIEKDPLDDPLEDPLET